MADIKSNAKSIRGRITAMEISAPPRIGLPMGDGSYIYVCCSSNEDCDRLWDWVQDITNTMNELDAMVDNWDAEIKKLETKRDQAAEVIRGLIIQFAHRGKGQDNITNDVVDTYTDGALSALTDAFEFMGLPNPANEKQFNDFLLRDLEVK